MFEVSTLRYLHGIDVGFQVTGKLLTKEGFDAVLGELRGYLRQDVFKVSTGAAPCVGVL